MLPTPRVWKPSYAPDKGCSSISRKTYCNGCIGADKELTNFEWKYKDYSYS